MRKCPTSVGVYLVMLAVLAGLAYAEDEEAVVVESAKKLKEITAKKVIWKKDGAEMAYYSGR